MDTNGLAPSGEVPTNLRQPEPGADVRTFLIADVRGYTRFTQAYGDEEAGRLAMTSPPAAVTTSRARAANLADAEATTVSVRLGRVDDELALVVEDDGHGFNLEQLAERLAEGHVGSASQRVRIEAAGGSMNVASSPGRGTRVEIRVPNKH
jgi:hypothetical protein